MLKFSYKISVDTLWTAFPVDPGTQKLKYFKRKSKHYFTDINSHLGLDIDLPYGYSNLVGLRLGNSIYLQNKKATETNFSLFINNKQLTLDTLLHVDLFNLRQNDEFTRLNILALYIDAKIEYKAVKLLKDELRKAGFYKVAYISNPSAEKYYESNIGITRKLPPIIENNNIYINPDIRKIVNKRAPPKPPKYFFDKPDFSKQNVCKIEIIHNQIMLNEMEFDLENFYRKMKNNNLLYTYLFIDDESSYDVYYSFISVHDSLRKEILNERSIEHFQIDYDHLIDEEKFKYLHKTYKFILIEN